jgi:CheY-like chemotaxis protein
MKCSSTNVNIAVETRCTIRVIKPIKESKLKQLCIDNLRIHFKNTKNQITSPVPQSEVGTSQNIDSYLQTNDISMVKDNVRILLAEDVYINQRVIVSFLNKMGFTNIQLVENGQQCLDYATQHDYDIILLDIRMPIMNGEIVYERLMENYKTNNKSSPYVVAVTAYSLREDKAKYLCMGFDDYIPKPVSFIELKNCMNKFLEQLLHD